MGKKTRVEKRGERKTALRLDLVLVELCVAPRSPLHFDPAFVGLPSDVALEHIPHILHGTVQYETHRTDQTCSQVSCSPHIFSSSALGLWLARKKR